MPVTINASNTSGFILNSDTSGILELQSAGITRMNVSSAGVSFAAQPLIGGVAPPAFNAYASTNATISSATFTKVILNTEDFDTSSRFNNTGSPVGGIPAYAFQPNVAGYYQVNMAAVMSQTASSSTNSLIALYKNGVLYRSGGNAYSGGQAANSSWNTIIFLNGTTDYIEMYVYTSAAAVTLVAAYVAFSASLVRGA
jgi:hypothetical protein